MTDATVAPGDAGEPRIVVLLVDDQRIVAEAVKRMLTAESDVDLHWCGDSNEAVARAVELRPTLILQDLVMPGTDGLTLVARYREQETTRDVPLIVLSSKEEATTKADAFAAGANDYLVKLPDRIELVARIRHHSRGYIHLLQRNDAYAKLLASQQALAAELGEAADYVRSLLPVPLSGRIESAWEFVPSTSLGGDSLGHHWIDDDHLAFYVLDVCGHGVGAALLSVSAMNVLGTRTLPGVDFRDPAAVLAALNDAFQMDRQNEMYFTIWYGVYRPSDRGISWSSAGHPPAVVVAPGAAPEPLRAQGAPIGALPGTRYASASATIPPGATLWIYSDGAYEVTRPAGGMMTLDEFVTIVGRESTSPAADVRRVLDAVRAEQGDPDFDDDVSMLALRFA
ncbi:MAG: SpoIIE family protein phosphatase [Alphaproteobacteria bacterium]